MIIKTPSRLHLGIIDIGRKFKRKYGAIGVTIKGGFTIEISKICDGLDIDASDKNTQEIKEVFKNIKSKLEFDHGFKVNVEENIPRHVGLGSTTQLSLGIGSAMAELSGYDLDIIEIAKIVKRGRFSAIGTYGFKYGGFILEGGKGSPEEIPPLIFREDFPEDWRFIIICSQNWKGYDEKTEKPIMEELTVNNEYPRRISHHIVMGLLPALKTSDIEDFGYHMSEIQKTVGESFSNFQHGEFHPAVADTIEELEKHTYGIGQSSWGPTVYGLTTKEEAENVKNRMKGWLKKSDKKARIWIGEAENKGAEIKR